MLPALTIVLVAVFALLGCPNRVQSDVQCYKCDSHDTSACGDPFDDSSSSITKCSGHQCLKTVDKDEVTRDCSTDTKDDLSNTCITHDDDDHTTTCACESDLCNTADNSRQLSFILVLVVTLLVALRVFHQ